MSRRESIAWKASSLKDFEQMLERISHGPYPPVFRGQADFSWFCETTFFRWWKRNTHFAIPDWNSQPNGMINWECDHSKLQYQNTAISILKKFETTLRLTGFNQPLDVQALAYLAQHYGIPTNLIDFTSDPFIAAYFATQNTPSGASAAIYVTSIVELLYIDYSLILKAPYIFSDGDKREFAKLLTTLTWDTLNTTTKFPTISSNSIAYNSRITAQQGSFIYHPNPFPFDQQMVQAFWQFQAKNRNTVIELDCNAVEEIRRFTRLSEGYSQRFLFPPSKIIENNQIRTAAEHVLQWVEETLSVEVATK